MSTRHIVNYLHTLTVGVESSTIYRMKHYGANMIKRIPKKEIAAFVDIVANAYPGMKISTPEEKKKMTARIVQAGTYPTTAFYGAYRSNKLIGGMGIYDFTMNYHSTMVPVGGVGLVAVDLLHKKEHVCKDLIMFFHSLCQKKKRPMAALYPFRPDFYRKMGYGYGTKINEYYMRPVDMPQGYAKKHLRYMVSKDKSGIKQCYERYFRITHGMFTERPYKWKNMFATPNLKIVVYRQGNTVQGYMVFRFKQSGDSNWIKHDIHLYELVYESRTVLRELLGFLFSQTDQVHRIRYATTDGDFHHILFDPRNGTDHMLLLLSHEVNVQGVGIMYRIIDIPGIFHALEKHDFNGVTCRIKLTVEDTFHPKNNGSFVLGFNGGKVSVTGSHSHDVEVYIGIAELSSLLMGVVDFSKLYLYGLADISKPRYLHMVRDIFFSSTKPICTTQF